jgi:hypothetical protein
VNRAGEGFGGRARREAEGSAEAEQQREGLRGASGRHRVLQQQGFILWIVLVHAGIAVSPGS